MGIVSQPMEERERKPDLGQSPPPDILVVGHSCFTSVNRNIYIRLAERGWRVELVVPQYLPMWHQSPADPRRAQDPPIHWIKVSGSHQRFWRFKGLRAVLERRLPRAVYLEGDPATFLAISVARWARRHQVPLLCYTNENSLLPVGETVRRIRVPTALRTLRSLFLVRFTRDVVAHTLVLSNASLQSMTVLGFGDRASKMPLGFDDAIFHPDAEARKRIRAKHKLQKPVVAYVGRFGPGKGVEFLVEALEQVLDIEWDFLLDDFRKVGDYASRIYERIAANPRLAARTQRFHADHYEIADYMNAFDVVVAPSCLREQYGRVLAEAMACGKVVIAADSGAYPEIVGDCGIIVPKGDAKALAQALRRVLTAPSIRSELGSKAAIRAAQELSIDVQLRIIHQRLEDSLSGC
jgi:glycosyltransferase involved in cell wall biosynthesis